MLTPWDACSHSCTSKLAHQTLRLWHLHTRTLLWDESRSWCLSKAILPYLHEQNEFSSWSISFKKYLILCLEPDYEYSAIFFFTALWDTHSKLTHQCYLSGQPSLRGSKSRQPSQCLQLPLHFFLHAYCSGEHIYFDSLGKKVGKWHLCSAGMHQSTLQINHFPSVPSSHRHAEKASMHWSSSSFQPGGFFQ